VFRQQRTLTTKRVAVPTFELSDAREHVWLRVLLRSKARDWNENEIEESETNSESGTF
jgi:hypothetical protein